MEDAEIQFKEALYRSAMEATYFLGRVVTGTEDILPVTDNAMDFRTSAAAHLIDSALASLQSPLVRLMLEEEVAEITAD